MSKYAFSKLQKLIRRYHNLQINKEIKSKELKNSRKNIYKELLIETTDTAQLIILKIVFFWISNGSLDRFASTTLPVSWAIKPGAFLPQLKIIYRIPNNSKIGNYDITIPHYNGTKTPRIPPYKKGPHRVALILKDGSQIIINAATENEGRRTINLLSKYVDKKWVTQDVRHTENQRVKTDNLVPIRADYFPNGQENSKPFWRHYF